MRDQTGTFSLPKWRLTRWLADPGQDIPLNLRQALIASLFGTLPIFIGGVANTVLVAAVAALRQPDPVFVSWFAFEVVLCVLRTYVIIAAFRAAAKGRETPTDLYIVLAVLWGFGVGYGTFISLLSGDWVIAALACLSSAAMMGGICFRNYAAPRLATAMIVLSFGPACLGAVLSGELIMLLTALQIPFYLFAMGKAVYRLNAMLVTTMRAERDNDYRARHDMLTGLSNRSGLTAALEQKWEMVQQGRQQIALLYLDLDGFKAINDNHGHTAGDTLLKLVGERLSNLLRSEDLAARIGGDEFVVLAQNVGPIEAMRLGDHLIEEVSAPYLVDGHEVVIGTSIGIASAQSGVASPDQLLKHADLALYEAKSQGRGTCCFFEPEMEARLRVRHALEADLRSAFVNGEFELFYQPQINIKENEISGFEALLRWRHPERGMIPPSEFIPVAEDIGLISLLGEWVLVQACNEAAQWPQNLKVAVNLSPLQFRRGTLTHCVSNALATSGLAPDRLELEITESCLLQENEETLSVLHQLRRLGIRIALDDFGTGYSSVSYLRDFPIDKIKIDGSFVRDICSRADAFVIVKSIISLGAGLMMSTVAEGIETEEQLLKIREAGCTEGQGYYFGRPKPPRELIDFLLGAGRRSADLGLSPVSRDA
jgi:diguanylate cyclase (GGDEF)-like protein